VIVPGALRAWAGIEKDVVSIGSMLRVEVWAKDRYERHIRDRGELPDFTSELGLF
jgi:MraZ protein